MEEPTAKIPFQVYLEDVEQELSHILNFWMLKSLDNVNGGFVAKMADNGTVDESAPKGSVLNARVLWSFSAAYLQASTAQYLMVADRAYNYIVGHFLDKACGGVFWSVDAAGKPLDTRKQIYALAYMIYGLSEYYKATQKAQALQLCQQLFLWIEKFSLDPVQGGYLEAFSRDGQLLDDLRLSPKDRNNPKTMNTHLHVLEAYANLYRVWPDQHLRVQLKKLLIIFLKRIVNPSTSHLNLFFDRNWNSVADMVSYGHDIEASWLLVEAARTLGEKELLDETERVAVALANASTEGLQTDGSLYHEVDNESLHYDKHREWWVSAEAMVGFMNAFQITQDYKYLEYSWNAWQFAKKHLLDKEQGEWYWGVNDDYSLMVSYDKIGFWKCPYHNTRACLEVLQRCRTLHEGEIVFNKNQITTN
ncbi:AGE family epimerase/isomerase [Pontibacter sp. 13R65]|uniref:AGE family epimerase/isomerase n=1 Tax=Pontibacter sp. 13R65 TaxID=3127458 RepID=UPI00301E56EC